MTKIHVTLIGGVLEHDYCVEFYVWGLQSNMSASK